MEEKETIAIDKKSAEEETISDDIKQKKEKIRKDERKQKIIDDTDFNDIKPEGGAVGGKNKWQFAMKFVGILLSTILIPVILSAYQNTTNEWVRNLFSNNEANQVSSDSKQEKLQSSKNQRELQSDEAVLLKLNQLASHGKIIKCDFSVGTSEQVLLQKWGEPSHKYKIGLVEYWDYKKRHIIFGVYNKHVVDIRSFDSLLQKLTLKELKESGKPDQEYDHMSLDQHFIVYHTGKYKLRMVFPKPTKNVPSPNLINISLVDSNYES